MARSGANGSGSCGDIGDSGAGGGGGGFGTAGGRGGDVDDGNPGNGGTTRGGNSLSPLMGGCRGGNAGASNATGAAGGGALQIASAGVLTVTGTIRANGGNGVTPGSCGDGGGTGGGSGGAILLEAGTVTTAGSTLQARGGTGGTGDESGYTVDNAGPGGTGSTASGTPGGIGGNGGDSGGGGGGGGYGRVRIVDTAGNENDTIALAQPVTIGGLATYEGDTSGMLPNVSATYYDTATNQCHATGGPDAFFTFTLAAATPVRISTTGSEFDTTLSLWNFQPGSARARARRRPIRSAVARTPRRRPTLSRHDTKTTAQTNTLGNVDGTWKVLGANSTGLTIEGLGTTLTRDPGHGLHHRRDRPDAPASIANLGALADRYTRTSGATTAGLNADYGENTLQCGLSADTSPDAIFRFTGTAGHTMRVGAHNPAGGIAAAYVSVFEADPGEQVLTRLQESPPANTNITPPTLAGCTGSTYGGHAYFICTTAAAWTAARNNCESAGMHLARIDSAGEETHVEGITTADAWIGGYDAQGGDKWHWTDNGEQYSNVAAAVGGRYVHWAGSEPNNSGDCMQLVQSTNLWDDSTCATSKQYVCEANLADLPADGQNFALGPIQRFDGSTASSYTRDIPAALWDQAQVYTANACTAHATAPDASFEFTVRGSDAYQAGLVHRYGFDGARSTVTDSVGAQHGTVVNTVLAGDGDLYFEGGTTDEHVNLPNGLISGLTSGATLEMWITWFGTGTAFQRALDFGDTTGAEGTQGTGNSYVFFTPKNASNFPRLAFKKAGTAEIGIDGSATFPIGTPVHVAMVFDDPGNAIRLYINNVAIGSALAWSDSLSAVNDVNDWLGRSQFNDPEFAGVIHELRIYNTPFTAGQVGSSFAAGLNPLGTLPVSVTLDTTGSAFDTVLSVWNTSTPLVEPAATTHERDTRAASRTMPIPGDVDGDWVVASANMANLTVSELTRKTIAAANANAVQNLTAAGACSSSTCTMSGEQVIVSGGNTSTGGIVADYVAHSAGLSCGALVNSGAQDVIYQFTPTAAGTIRASVESPTPGFSPIVALFDGQNGAPLTGAQLTAPDTAQGAGNDPLTTPASVGNFPGVSPNNYTSVGKTWTGNTTGFTQHVAASLYEEARNYDDDSAALCGGVGGGDAFFSFVTDGTRDIEISAVLPTTGFNHALALWNNTVPLTRPSAAGGSYDTPALAASNAIGPIDGSWITRSGDMSVFGVQGVTERSLASLNDETTQVLSAGGAISGEQLIVTGGNTAAAAVAPTYPGYCGANANADDVIYRFTPTASTNVRIQIDNPTPSYTPVMTLYDGGNGFDPLTESEQNGTPTAVANTNENPVAGSAHVVTIGAAVAYSGNTASMRSAYYGGGTLDQWDEAPISGTEMCTANIASPDAFYTFTVDGNTDVRINAAGTSYAHALSLYDSTPIKRPDDTTVAANQSDTRANAFNAAGQLGAIDGTWKVRSTASSGWTVDGLTSTTEAGGGDGITAVLVDGANNDTYVNGESITVTGGTTASYAADYPSFDDTAYGSPVCGTSDSAPDAIYRLRVSSDRSVNITMSNPTFAGSIALFDGQNGDPLTNAEINAVTTVPLGAGTAPATAPTNCPTTTGVQYYGGSWYYYCEGSNRTFDQANDDCQAAGGELVQVDRQDEQNT